MSNNLSGSTFRKGLESVSRNDYLEALAYFETSLILIERAGAHPPMKYLSYSGLSLAMAGHRLREAREICEGAVDHSNDDPELYLNLGRVYLLGGDRARAFHAFVRGLQIDGRHQGLIGEMYQLGFRRPRVLRFLERGHPINRLLGSLRTAAERNHWMRSHDAA